MIDPNSLDIKVDTKEEKFYVDIRKVTNAYMDYKLHTDDKTNVVEITKTYVPDTLESIGIEDQLAEQAIEFANKNGYKLRATCPTFRHFMNRHPEYAHMQG